MHPMQTKAWKAAQAAQAELRVVVANPASTPEQKKTARDVYAKKMRPCLKESGLIR